MSGNENFQYLNQINGPEDVKALNEKQVETLTAEIRSFLVQTVEETGGHLASNLGVVELSVALHRVFSTPHDHIIFDVGHQSYVHKLLTGRREAFATLRQAGGLSGFTKRRESEHDCFGAGHSSTSLSAALGLARADALAGSDAYTVAVVGDGAFTGGMIHEALNNCDSHLKLIVVMNENEMSISPNHGRFADSLSKIRSRERYFLTKQATVKFLENIPLVGKAICRGLRRLKKFLKNGLYGSNYFENMGLYYLGPVDGNDMKAVEGILRMAREQNDSVIVHLKTQKGKGYAPAEENPDRYHSLPPRDEKKGEGSFSACFGKKLTAEAERDERITAITAAMRDGTGLSAFSDAYPDRFFDVGIAEEHAVTFAAGLAAGGRRPVVAIYSTFLQRAYDNIAHDVALQQLPVCFCIDRAGLNSADGPTHHGIFDVAFLSAIPHMKIYTPATYGALEAAMSEALASDMPSAIRYPRSSEERAVVERFYADGAPKSLGIRADFTPSDRPSAVVI
ncbi:MAG: 1-deoxy-D-xylulose-5-phosphate synthase, partial [Clostridia bacterium]|nr:1-deoxy-D-xylulose-5-phosphate synthase [Clostridia bacterium]